MKYIKAGNANHIPWYAMSELNIAVLLPSTSAVIRPFGQIDIQRPIMTDAVTPTTPEPSVDCKRKYDWSEHQNAPIRQNKIARPFAGFI